MGNTPSDFGTQGEKPSHPELLDDLAARFVANKWSLKWLNREIMLSATYQQASRPRADGLEADEANALLWRQNPQRLDSEAYRDTLVRAAGVLDPQMGGRRATWMANPYFRRAIYGRVRPRPPAADPGAVRFPGGNADRAGPRCHHIDAAADFPDEQCAFLQNPGEAAAKKATANVAGQPQQVAALYRQILSRNPTPAETAAALAYLQKGSMARYAQVLLSTNERDFPAMSHMLSRRKMIEAIGGGLGMVGLTGPWSDVFGAEPAGARVRAFIPARRCRQKPSTSSCST